MTPFAQLEQQLRNSGDRVRALQQRLGAISDKADPRRGPLKLELEQLEVVHRGIKEQIKLANSLRNFAGIGSPLHEACVARLSPDVVAELEADALARQQERTRKSEQRRAAKGIPAAQGQGAAPTGPKTA